MTRHRRRAQAGLTVGVVAATQLVTSGGLLANNFYGATSNTTCGGNMQDNGTMTYHRDGNVQADTDLYNAIARTLNEEVSPTDISLAAEQSSPNGDTDVVFQNANYTGSWCGYTWHNPGSLLGYVSCASLSGSACQRFNVYLDQSWTVNQTRARLDRFSCHETGHALGLIHPTSSNGAPQSCVTSGHPVFGYSDHEVKHLNDNY